MGEVTWFLFSRNYSKCGCCNTLTHHLCPITHQTHTHTHTQHLFYANQQSSSTAKAGHCVHIFLLNNVSHVVIQWFHLMFNRHFQLTISSTKLKVPTLSSQSPFPRSSAKAPPLICLTSPNIDCCLNLPIHLSAKLLPCLAEATLLFLLPVTACTEVGSLHEGCEILGVYSASIWLTSGNGFGGVIPA